MRRLWRQTHVVGTYGKNPAILRYNTDIQDALAIVGEITLHLPELHFNEINLRTFSRFSDSFTNFRPNKTADRIRDGSISSLCEDRHAVG